MNPEDIDTKEEVISHQKKLNDWAQQVGYKPLIIEPLKIDGKYGRKTEQATIVYEEWLANQPAPPAPWWTTGRIKGMLTEYSGLILGTFGIISIFVPSIKDIDAKEILNTIIDNMDHIDSIIVAIGALLAASGRIWSTIGAIRAKAPIDTKLVARIGNRDFKLPSMHKSEVQSNDTDKSAKPIKKESESNNDWNDIYGNFKPD